MRRQGQHEDRQAGQHRGQLRAVKAAQNQGAAHQGQVLGQGVEARVLGPVDVPGRDRQEQRRGGGVARRGQGPKGPIGQGHGGDPQERRQEPQVELAGTHLGVAEQEREQQVTQGVLHRQALGGVRQGQGLVVPQAPLPQLPQPHGGEGQGQAQDPTGAPRGGRRTGGLSSALLRPMRLPARHLMGSRHGGSVGKPEPHRKPASRRGFHRRGCHPAAAAGESSHAPSRPTRLRRAFLPDVLRQHGDATGDHRGQHPPGARVAVDGPGQRVCNTLQHRPGSGRPLDRAQPRRLRQDHPVPRGGQPLDLRAVVRGRGGAPQLGLPAVLPAAGLLARSRSTAARARAASTSSCACRRSSEAPGRLSSTATGR